MSFFSMKKMGVPGKCPAHMRAWTVAEDETLIAMYPTATFREIGLRLNRSEAATRYHARQLRHAGLLQPKHIAFTMDDDRFIRRNRHSLTAKEIALLLGRSTENIYRRAKLLGVSLAKCGDSHWSTKYPDEDVELICALRDDGMRLRDIAEKFETSPQMVSWLCNKRLMAVDAMTVDREVAQ